MNKIDMEHRVADCLSCTAKACRTKQADCFHLHDGSLAVYSRETEHATVLASSALVDDGRAGTLSRIQELIEFIHLRHYKKVGLAYCFGLEPLAQHLATIMRAEAIDLIPARCSMGGVMEREIDPSKTKDTVSCNPAGQAHFLNQRADFVIEMGLCLGHDVIFHQELRLPFTVLLVKDRVHAHNPLEGIRQYKSGQT